MTLAICLSFTISAFLFGQAAKPIYLDAIQPVKESVVDLLGSMTLYEKVGQMNMPCVCGGRGVGRNKFRAKIHKRKPTHIHPR
jgi:hypothetical protein